MRRCKMDDEAKKTKRAEEDIVSSGVTPGSKTQKDEKTVIKSGVAVAPAPTTQIISAGIVSAVGSEIVLNNKNYKILKVIARSTGEAEVYLLEIEKQKYIFKYYYPAFKPKETILQQLKGLTHEDIIDLIDYGYYYERFFEILEYAEGGTLMETNPDGTYRYIPIKDIRRLKQIVKETVDALEFCHSRGIIHRDIKPENIFFVNPDGTDIQIGDFGISSALDEGLSKHLTGQARTEIYAAPELYQSIGGKTVISKEVDYYAFGITLIHIFSGEEPFKDLDSLSIMKVKCDGKVYIPEDMPEELKNLIKGLITVEPSKRWSYGEVQKWLKGEYVPVYFKTLEFKYELFPFGVIKGEDVVARDPAELSDLLLKYPDIGRAHIYKGRIEKWLENAKNPLFAVIERIREKEYPTDENAGLIKISYLLNPSKGYTTFAGVECKNPVEIGDAIEQESSYYKSYLTENEDADLFLYFEARDEKDVADAFRKYAQAYNPERALNLMVLELQGKYKFKMEKMIFLKPEDLVAADDNTKDKLAKMLSNLDSKLSIWLKQFTELKGQIDNWRKSGRFEAATLSYAIEKGSPFHFYGDLAYSARDFENLFEKNITDASKLSEMTTPKTIFIREADYWLQNFQHTNYFKFLNHYLKNKAPKIDKKICSALLDCLIKTKKFDVTYYWDTLKPMIEKGELLCEEDILKTAEGLLEEYKDNLRSVYYTKQKELKELLSKTEKKIKDIPNPSFYSFYKVYEEAKTTFSTVEPSLPENQRQKAESAISLIEKAIDGVENTVLPEIERIAQRVAFAKQKASETVEERMKLAFRMILYFYPLFYVGSCFYHIGIAQDRGTFYPCGAALVPGLLLDLIIVGGYNVIAGIIEYNKTYKENLL